MKPNLLSWQLASSTPTDAAQIAAKRGGRRHQVATVASAYRRSTAPRRSSAANPTAMVTLVRSFPPVNTQEIDGYRPGSTKRRCHGLQRPVHPYAMPTISGSKLRCALRPCLTKSCQVAALRSRFSAPLGRRVRAGAIGKPSTEVDVFLDSSSGSVTQRHRVSSSIRPRCHADHQAAPSARVSRP